MNSTAVPWGGWYANVLETATTDEEKEFVASHPLTALLRTLEETKTLNELFCVVRAIEETDVQRLNSPLLDHLRSIGGSCHLDDIILTGCTTVVRFCMDRGFDPDRDTNGRCLYLASICGATDVCELLLDHGVNIHAGNNTALQFASTKEVCKLLLDRGANVHADRDYALKFAAFTGRKDICEVLLDHGANINVITLDGLDNRHKDVNDLLRQRGARPSGDG